MDRLSPAQARRIALAAQGFTDRRPTGPPTVRHLRRAIERVGLLQIDSVNVLVRSHELPLFSRLGPYPRRSLTDLIEKRRELFEYWAHVASFVPVHLQPSLRWRMERAGRDAWADVQRMQRERPGYIKEVLAQVTERGPMVGSQLVDPGEKQGPWWGWADGKTALEWLFWTGELTSAGRGANFERRYDLPERVLPRAVLDAPTPSVEEAHRTLLVASARSHGIGTARDLADYFRLPVISTKARLAELAEEGIVRTVTVTGWKEPAYVHADAKLPRRVQARALLSPFDSLIWERARTERLFGMRVRLEVYTPAPKRVHGYYVLPFLLGDELVARVDLKSDRQNGALLAQAAHLEPQHEARADEIAAALAEELRSMATWLELERVEVGARGDLSAALAARRSSTIGP